MKAENKLQIYSCITVTILALVIWLMYTAITKVDLLETIIVFICFIAPLTIILPFYISEGKDE